MAVQLDALDQISYLLRNKPDVRNGLRELLIGVWELSEYQDWLDNDQYAGHHFRLPRRFAPTDASKRRLLEQLELVTDDVLRVRVNVDKPTQRVFITDGLFVPAQFRVFPWLDESDRIQERYRELGWADWADTVVDPATGCGHNLLRYPAEGMQRLGFDVSSRAIAFASINGQLNFVPEVDGSDESVFLGLNDVRRGIPAFRARQQALVLINMPFALEPVPETLAPTAAGGENGYELTLAALAATRRFVEEMRGATAVRAVVLAYSVGSTETGEWVVEKAAREAFAGMSVNWTLLSDELLWRINGRKEQPNPMPLENLALKADCKYYVRDPSRRDEVKLGYERKTESLRLQGFTHLAYGVVDVS